MAAEHRLLILAAQADEYARLVAGAALPGLELVAAAGAGEALAHGADCDLVLGEPALIREALPGLSRLKWAQAIWAGVEPLVEPGLRRDYLLTNARGIFGGLIAEFVFGYLLAHACRHAERQAAQQAGQWDRSLTGSLRGKDIGLLGVGSIGSALAGVARGFGMRVRGFTLESESCPDVERYFHGSGRLAFADGLDYLVCTLPGTMGTRHIVDAELLAHLPGRAVFVNAGRGAAVDEAALDAALRSGRLAAAVLDVCEQEPPPPDHPFWTTPKLTLTAHVAGPTLPEDMLGVFVENYRRLRAGEPLLYRVDFERGY